MKHLFLHPYRATVALCIGVVLLLPAALDHPKYERYLTATQWETDGAFVANGQPNPRDFPSRVLRSPDARFWRNYTPAKGVVPAQLRSTPFILSSNRVIIPVVGFPNSEEAGIYLESEIDHQRFGIRDGAADLEWQPFTLSVPKSLTNTQFRLIAFSKSRQAYIGVGTPYFRTNRALPGLAFSKIFSALFVSVAYLFLLFFPSFYWLTQFKTFAPTERVLASFVLTSVLALPLFFLAFYFPAAGRLFAHLWLLLSGLLLCTTAITRSYLCWSGAPKYCLFILIALTVFHGFFLFSFNMVSVPYAANYLFYPASWTTDNQIPTTTARLLAQGTIVSEWPFGSWRLSDRTPLLASLLYPAAVVTRDFAGRIDSGVESMIPQICGFGIQNCWLLPAWILFRRLRFKRQECVLASLLLAGTPFIFFNSVYIWPKLLSATFCLAQYLYLVPSQRGSLDPPGHLRAALGGTAAALAILSHAGSAVAVLAIFIAVIHALHLGRLGFSPNSASALERVRTFIQRWRWILLSGLVTVLVLSPWLVWTKLGLPTSNALPKYFFTGGFGFDTPNEGVVHAALRFYHTLTLKQWLTSKGLGLAALGGFYHGDLRNPLGTFTNLSSKLGSVRACQFLYLMPSLGILCIPIVALVRALKRRKMNDTARRLVSGLGLAAIVSFALQFSIMMSPHLLPTYPYYVPFALHLLAVIGIVMLRASAPVRWLAALSYITFVLFWIALPTATTSISSILALLASLALILLATITVFKLLLKNASRARRI